MANLGSSKIFGMLNMCLNKIIGVATPTDANDAANKAYVDDGLSGKVDKVVGKGLSTEDYTTAEKTKLAGISDYVDTAIEAAIGAAIGGSY